MERANQWRNSVGVVIHLIAPLADYNRLNLKQRHVARARAWASFALSQ